MPENHPGVSEMYPAGLPQGIPRCWMMCSQGSLHFGHLTGGTGQPCATETLQPYDSWKHPGIRGMQDEDAHCNPAVTF